MTDAPEKPSDQRQRDLDAASRVIHECLISERMSVAILADAIAQARHDAMTDAANAQTVAEFAAWLRARAAETKP